MAMHNRHIITPYQLSGCTVPLWTADGTPDFRTTTSAVAGRVTSPG